MTPHLSLGHRFGNVFVGMKFMLGKYRAGRVVKLTPDEATETGRELLDLARRARKEPPPKTLKIRRHA